MTTAARIQTPTVSAERPEQPGERRRRRGTRRPAPDSDGQDVVREELGVLVRVAHAGRRCRGCCRQLVLVELVAERDRQQEQAAEDARGGPGRGGEDERRRVAPDEVAAPATSTSVAMSSPLNSALDEAQERQLEQEEADVLAEDRVRDRRRRSARTAPGAATAGSSPRPTRPAGDDQRDEHGDADEDRRRPSGVRSGRSSASNVGRPASRRAVAARCARRAPAGRPRQRRSARADRATCPPRRIGRRASRPASQRLTRRTSRATTRDRGTGRPGPRPASRTRCRTRRSGTTERPSTGRGRS